MSFTVGLLATIQQDIVEGVRFVLRLSANCTIPEIVFMRPGETAGLV